MKKAFVALMMVALLAACAPSASTPISTSSLEPTVMLAEESPAASAIPLTEQPLVVAFAKNGDIHLWDSETQQSRMIVKAGDITTIMMSDDGQLIAFLRRSSVQLTEPDWYEQYALWAVDRNGENPREIVSAATLRQLLNPSTTDSTGFGQISWIPHTHRLVYSGVKYNAAGQGFTNSKDIYLVDADTLSNTVPAPDVMPDTFLHAWRFVLSPDGQQIALFSGTELSFLNVDGSNWRPAVLTYPYPPVMGDGVLLPTGVWTQDSRAFVFTGSMPSEPLAGLNYTIWRVPVDGSPAQPLATLTESHSGSITFSPDGQRMAFFQDINGDGVIQTEDYRIMPLAVEAGPLAIPYTSEWGALSNPHWSPAGTAFVIKDREILQLCPDATQISQVCGDPIHMKSDSNIISSSIQWVDSTRFLFTGLEPSTLSLGNVDGTILPIATWTDDDVLSGWSFHTPQ